MKELNKEQLYDLSQFYRMFSDPTRIKIMLALNQNKLCVGEIAEQLKMTQSSISHQLQTLRYANLVRYEKVGKEAYYYLADDHIKIILNYGIEHTLEGGRYE